MKKLPRILIVDDHVPNLMAVRLILQDLAYITCANSGEEALRQLLDQEFDLILLDVVMPNMDGFQTAERIRQDERSRQSPIIFLTAVASDPRAIERAQAVGAIDYVVKPFTAEALRAKVLEVLQPDGSV
jgi:CheY-like chemotaxis protein